MNSQISVLILTYNEEVNIGRCLKSLKPWFDDIVVLDSYSHDRTGEIVSNFQGVRLVKNKFVNYAEQRNFGLNEIDYNHKWLFMVDADEVVEESLVLEMLEKVNNAESAVTMFRMRRKDFFEGKWIRRSSGYPTWFGRLMRIGSVSIERDINEEFLTSGTIVELEGHLLHYPFNKGLAYWFERHNKYSSMEAEIVVRQIGEKVEVKDIFSRDAVKKRRVIKNILYKTSFRPVIVFLALYIFRMGFLDGSAGFRFSVLRSFYEYMIVCKSDEVRNSNQTNV